MQQPIKEYRYGSAARRRAALFLGLSVLLIVVLLGVLATRWADLGGIGKVVGLFLLVLQLFTIRGQLARLTYRCQITPDALRLVAPLNNQTIAWREIMEVRKMPMPQFGSQGRWACTIFRRGAAGHPIPTYLFDDQLEDPEDALREIAQRTPEARHTNI